MLKSVCFAIDDSGSMMIPSGKALAAYVRHILATVADLKASYGSDAYISVVTCGAPARELLDWTRIDSKRLVEKLEDMEMNWGGTDIAGGLKMALQKHTQLFAHQRDVFLYTDGMSAVTRDDYAALAASDVNVHAFGIGEMCRADVLRIIARVTDGSFTSVFSVDNL